MKGRDASLSSDIKSEDSTAEFVFYLLVTEPIVTFNSTQIIHLFSHSGAILYTLPSLSYQVPITSKQCPNIDSG